MARVDFFVEPPGRHAVPQRGEHPARLHHHLDVSQDVGGLGAALPGAARPPDRAGARAPRREAAAPYQRHLMRSAPAVAAGAPARPGSTRRRLRPDATPRRPRAPRTTPSSTPGSSACPRILTARLRAGCGPAAARCDRLPARPAPPPCCQVMDLVSRWWQLQARRARPAGRRRRSRAGRRGHRRHRGVGGWREPATAEAWFYLGAELRRARAVARPARAAAGGRARRQADQGIARARARARPAHAGRALRRRPLPVLRRRGAGGCSGCCAGCCSSRAATGGGLRAMQQARTRAQLLRERGRLPAAPRLSSGTSKRPSGR